jgi:hypothetical protein
MTSATAGPAPGSSTTGASGARPLASSLRRSQPVQPAIAAAAVYQASSLPPHTAATMRKLGDLTPSTLSTMHGSSFTGDGRQAFHDLAAAYEQLIDAHNR